MRSLVLFLLLLAPVRAALAFRSTLLFEAEAPSGNLGGTRGADRLCRRVQPRDCARSAVAILNRGSRTAGRPVASAGTHMWISDDWESLWPEVPSEEAVTMPWSVQNYFGRSIFYFDAGLNCANWTSASPTDFSGGVAQYCEVSWLYPRSGSCDGGGVVLCACDSHQRIFVGRR